MRQTVAWFKCDDRLHASRKAAKAGVAAMGLWVLAGSWSASEELDGFVPAYMVARLGGSDEQADALVNAGLWVLGDHDGEAGFRFHAWDEYQPTRAALEAKRETARERMRTARAQGGDVRANSERTSRAVTPTPTRPDPSPKSESRKRATQLPTDFAPNDGNRRIAQERGLDLDAVVAQWSDWHRSKGSTFKDWHAALNTWLRREQPTLPATPQQPRRRALAQCPDVTPHPRHDWHDRSNHNLCQGV